MPEERGSPADRNVAAAEPLADAWDRAVLQHGRWYGHGKGSRLEFEFEVWILYRFRDGKVTATEYFTDGDLATAAAHR